MLAEDVGRLLLLRLLGIWIAQLIESRLLRLKSGLLLQIVGLLLLELIWVETCWLWLALESIGESILEAGLLLIRKSSGLGVLVVEVSSALRLLLLHWIAKPVDCSLLLISLIIARDLWLSSWRGCIIE